MRVCENSKKESAVNVILDDSRMVEVKIYKYL